ncbi:MAG: tetratricopeptide repeat protein [Desulfuromonadaceae bacterium]|nr:tetratricopeptide repeat protein [Desulfuromonadaceae bacterium]
MRLKDLLRKVHIQPPGAAYCTLYYEKAGTDFLHPTGIMHNSRNLILCTVLTVVIGTVFSVALGNNFVGDDLTLTIGNPAYRDFLPDRIFRGLANGLEYLPVRDLSIALDYQIWGESPRGFHFTNLLIYLLTCLAVYWVTLLLGRHFNHDHPELLAGAAALLFGLHPLQAESVGLVACRNVLLSGLFTFLAAGCYLRFRVPLAPRRRLWLVNALFCFLLASLSKATGLSLPLALLGIDLLSKKDRQMKKLVSLLPFFFLAATFFILFRAIALGSNIFGRGTDHGGILGNIAVALQIPWFYLSKLLLPLGLGTEYPDKFNTILFSPVPLAALAGLIVLLGTLAWSGSRYPIAAVAIVWFCAFLLPVLNLFRTYPTVADRYAFLPSYGFALLMAWGLNRLVVVRPKCGLSISIIIVMGWGTCTVLRLPTWQTELSYWQDALVTNPKNAKATMAIGAHYYNSGHFDLALKYFAQARELDPNDPMYDYASGDHELLQGNPRAAIPHLLRALGRKQDNIMALLDLGDAYAAIGQRDNAIDAYRRIFSSTEIDPQEFYKRAAQAGLQKLGSTP